MAISIRKRSRLRFAQDTLTDGTEYWDILELPELPPQADDQFYTVKAMDRADLIANQFYQDPTMWWVIAYANNLELIPTEITEGMILRIPSQQYLLQTFFLKVVQ